MKNNCDPVIVVIATSMERTDMLLERSLRSVYEQENVNPRAIYVVDDNKKINSNDRNSGQYYIIKRKIKNFRRDFFGRKLKCNFQDVPDSLFHTSIVSNTRTHGNSGTGAWNTGAFRALEFSTKNYLAILDDDDEWHPSYLRECLDKSQIRETENHKERVVAVITGILRKEPDKTIEMIIAPSDFTAENFFIGNPGFQGSNMFIRLDTFWKIGGFDESMRSATDRDLAIRLIEYQLSSNSARFQFNEKCLVTHYVHAGQVTSNFNNKCQGLDLFYRKYLHLMDENIKKKSMERAKRLFNYNYSVSIPVGIHNFQKQLSIAKTAISGANPFNLLIGITSNNTENLKNFLSRYTTLPNRCLLQEYNIIIFENTGDEFAIRPIILYFTNEKGLNIKLITTVEQKEILKNYPYKDLFSDESVDSKSIAFSRSLLQYYLRGIAKEKYQDNCVIWIVDDDLIPEVLIDGGKHGVEVRQMDFLEHIALLKEKKAFDIVLGTVTDAPPLPFLSSLRTQLLDLYFNLSWFSQQNPGEEYSNNLKDNLSFMSGNRDFYYDLSSKDFKHLETPFWWLCIENSPKNIRDAFDFFLDDIIHFGKACNVFRPLIIREEDWGILGNESILRGGNTLIFNPEVLEFPNYSPTIGNKEGNLVLRRSDFNWAIAQQYIFKRKVMEANIPLRHHRRLQSSSFILNEEKLTSDLYGMAFYRALLSLLQKKSLDSLSKKDLKRSTIFFKAKLKEIIKKMKINNLRSQNLAWKIICLLQDTRYWWYKNEYRSDLNSKIQEVLYIIQALKYEIGKRKFQIYIKSIEKGINRTNNTFIEQYIEKIRLIVSL